MNKAILTVLVSLGFMLISTWSTLHAAGVHKVYDFRPVADGVAPVAKLVKLGGWLFGVTTYGGSQNNGTIFAFNPQTGVEKVVHNFTGKPDGANPEAPMILVHGLFYGTTANGGAHNDGTVFTLSPETGSETILYSFDKAKGGSTPLAGLTEMDGLLYGTTIHAAGGESGTIFSIDPSTGRAKFLYSFSHLLDEGGYPLGTLVHVGERLWGTALLGGDSNGGTIFAINPKTRVFSVVHSFQQAEGQGPRGDLLRVGHTLYGTAQYDPSDSLSGIVYAIETNTGAFSTVYDFGQNGKGYSPSSGVVMAGGTLFGTTDGGGTCPAGKASLGTLYSLDPVTQVESTIHLFCDKAGENYNKMAGLLVDGSKLYGLDGDPGTGNVGFIFVYHP